MIVVAFVVVAALAIGFPLAALLARRWGVGAIAGSGFLLGISSLGIALFVVSLARAPWSSGLLVGIIALLVVASWSIGMQAVQARRGEMAQIEGRSKYVAFAAFAVTAATLFGYAKFATAAPMLEFDFIGDWGLKGRMFWEYGGIDWSFLQRAWHIAIHPDYPILLPLIYDVFSIAQRGWNDQTIGLLFPVIGASLLLIVYDRLRVTSHAWFAAIATLALMSFAVTPWLGLAEGPLIAFFTCGILLLRDAVRDDNPALISSGAVFLGLAAFTKNEGLTFIVAAAMGLLASGVSWRRVLRLWPAVAIPAPWLVLRAAHHLRTDLVAGNVLSRFIDHLAHPGTFLSTLAQYPAGKEMFWLAVALSLVIGGFRLIRRERLILTAVALQMLFYVAAYFTTPHDMAWHVRWSWERLVSHVALMLGFVACVALGEIIAPERAEIPATEE